MQQISCSALSRSEARHLAVCSVAFTVRLWVCQVMGILAAMMTVRFGLEPLVKSLRTVFKASGAWEKSSEYHFLREVRSTCVL